MATINGGLVARLLPMTTWTFSGLDAGQTENVIFTRQFNASVFTEGHLQIRMYESSVLSAGTSIKVSAKSDAHAFDDPTDEFTQLQGSVTFTSADAVPGFRTLGITLFGRLLQVDILATQASPAAALVASMSVDLVLKGGDPAALDLRPGETLGYWTI